MRKSLITKSLILIVCLAFLAVLPPALGDLFGKDNPTISRLDTVGSSAGIRHTLDMVELQVPR